MSYVSTFNKRQPRNVGYLSAVAVRFLLALALASCNGGGPSTPPNQLPTANAGGPYSSNVGQSVTFDGSKSNDPDSDSLTYSWNFGDNLMGTGVKPSHTYSSAGMFTVSLTVSDGRGGTNTATTTATINGVPTANPGGPYNGMVGQALQFDGSKSSDVDNDTLTFAWNFGDNSTGTGAKPTHTYSSAASFTVSLTVDDGKGGTNSAATTANIMAAAPAISNFSPKSGPVGTLVSVTGNNFRQPNGTGPQIALQAQGGGTLNAPISVFTATTASFVIPAGASSGRFTLSVGGQTATSPSALTVTAASNFTLSAAPASANLLPGQTVAYAVSLASPNGFSQLVPLAVSGLPTGVTASFSPAQIKAGQSSILTLTAARNQTVGPSNLTISGSATVQGILESQSATVSLNVQSLTTTFLGRTVVDDARETPIVGVTVKFLGVDDKGNITGCTGQTASDAGGNFALSNLSAACVGPQLISYDGTTASSPTGKYAGVNLSYALTSGQVTTSPVLIHLPRIDNAETVQVEQNASGDQVFTFKTIPDLVVIVYAGTTFSLQDGTQPNPFPLIAVQVPVDRLPDVMPTNGTLTPFIVAFQPANAVASQPVAVNFPNILNNLPGTTATLVTLDPTRGYMVPYGTGTVSNDGTKFIADPDPSHPAHAYGLVHFDWHGPAGPPGGGPNPGGGSGGGGGPPGGPPPPPPPGPPGGPPPPPPLGGPCPGCCGNGPPPPRGGQCGSNTSDDAPDEGSSPNSGDPIDVATGLQVVHATDIRIAGARGTIGITRTYRTLSTVPGPFGIGTSHNYGMLLATQAFLQGKGVLTLVTPDGNQYPFVLQPNGSLVNTKAPIFRGATITVPSMGTYVFRTRHGTTYTFQSPSSAPLIALLNSITDSNGNTIRLVHGNSNVPDQITQIVDPVGRVMTVAYDSSDHIISVDDTMGRNVSYTYNSQGTLAMVTDAAGGLTKYTYDSQNRLTQVTDARNVVIAQNTYDANGRVIQQVQANGGVIKYVYTLLNPMVPASPVLTTAVTDALGNVTSYRFDPTGLLLDVTDPLGQKRVFTHDPQHNNMVVAVTGTGICPACGRTTLGDQKFTYDANGNMTSRTDGLGNTWNFTFDLKFDKVTSATDPLGNVTKFTYDAKGNVVSATDANGNSVSFTVNSFGLITQVTDPLGQSTSFTYDSSGNAVAARDPLGNITALTYDAVSRPVTLTNALGGTTSIAYDAFDRVLTQTNAQGKTRRYAYDPVGNLLSLKDESGDTTSFAYDGMSLLLTKTDPRGKTDTRTRDLNGSLIKFVDRRGQTNTFSRDALGRITLKSFQDGSTVAVSFDGNGRIAHAVDSQGGASDFQYDAAGRLTSSSNQVGTVQYSYDSAGRQTSREVVGQSTLAYSYDAAGRLLSASQPQAAANFSYDARDALLRITRSNGVSSQYSYDAAGRLLSIVHSGQGIQNSLTNSNDPLGDRSQLTTNSTVPTPVVNAFDAANRLVSSGPTSYTYDDNGNRTSAVDPTGTTTYVWDARDRLQSISFPNGEKTAFTYDYASHLITQSDSGPTLNLTQSFVLDNRTNVAYIGRSNGDNLLVLSGRSIDQHLAVVHSGGQVEYGLLDASSSTIATVDQTGKPVSSFSYEPFGKTTTTSSFPFQFTGRVSVNAKLYDFRARFYDPCVGRFISEDPIFHGGNAYAYALNNPATLGDPTGKQVTPWSLGKVTKEVCEGLLSEGLQYESNQNLQENSYGWAGVEAGLAAGLDIVGCAGLNPVDCAQILNALIPNCDPLTPNCNSLPNPWDPCDSEDPPAECDNQEPVCSLPPGPP